ncbi:MAG: RlmE family RNA methyltransferase [Alphaproteobacteria bacterium]|nr:RlmE family RNA methyltransferase [Alphaproteobacteria bacterium]
MTKDGDEKVPGRSAKKPARRTTRDASVRVKKTNQRTTSSARWLQRQLNDPYVHEAQRLGYRARSAFKLIELDDKLKFIKKGCTVVDLGAAPGGWSQVALERGAGKVIGLDLLPIEPLPGVTFLQMDFMNDDAPEALIMAMGSGADVVLSDMAPNTMGHKQTDHLRIMALVEAAYEFATQVLKPGGTFVSKLFQGGAQKELLDMMKRDFTVVKHVKPPASRKESAEQYVVATGYRRPL